MDVTFHALYISKTLLHHIDFATRAWGLYSTQVVRTFHSFKFEYGALARSQGESMSPPSDRRCDVKPNGILFPSFFPTPCHFHYLQLAALTISNMAPEGIYIFPTHSWQHRIFQIWRRREIFPYSQLARVGHFHSSQLATLIFSNLAPEGRESRDRGSGGGNFIPEKIITSPGICLTHYY